MNDNLCDCIKCDNTDDMMMKVALALASRAEILEGTDNLPSVDCVIRGFNNHLPVYSVGWNGFISNIDKKDLDAIKSCREPSKEEIGMSLNAIAFMLKCKPSIPCMVMCRMLPLILHTHPATIVQNNLFIVALGVFSTSSG